MRNITNGRVTLKKGLNRAGATPLLAVNPRKCTWGHSRPPRRFPAARFARVIPETQEFVRQNV